MKDPKNGVANVFYGTEGSLVVDSYASCTAYDPKGTVIEMPAYEGDLNGNHFTTFVKAVKTRKLDLDRDVRWTGLDVLATTGGSLLSAEGTVEFRAHYVIDGVAGDQHENSRFVRDGGRWRYLDGVSVS